jgi:hypothetical protein
MRRRHLHADFVNLCRIYSNAIRDPASTLNDLAADERLGALPTPAGKSANGASHQLHGWNRGLTPEIAAPIGTT